MIKDNIAYNRAQLQAMEDYDITEYEMAIFMEIVIQWDEAGRPDQQWHSSAALMYLLERFGKIEVIQQHLRNIREKELVTTNSKCKNWKLTITPEGIKVAKSILHGRNAQKYLRVIRTRRDNGEKRVYYNNVVWDRVVKMMRDQCVILERGEGLIRKSSHIYMKKEKVPAFLEALRVYKGRQELSVIDLLKRAKAPALMLEKVEMFGEKNLPAWLRYDIEKFTGQKLAI